MSWLQGFLIAMLPPAMVALGLVVLEVRRHGDAADWWRNLQSWGVTRVLSVTALPLFPLWGDGKWSLIDGSALPFWLGFPIFLVTRDLAEFVFHWIQHRIPFLWAMHSLHHSDPDMGALTHQRHFWADQFVAGLTVVPAALLVISPTPEILAGWGVFGLWNYVYHSRIPMNFGRWSWLLNCPDYHRIHHSSDPAHYNTNFAALLPVFDVLFGTYRPATTRPATGLARNVGSLREMLLWPIIHDEAVAGETGQAQV
jgi:sterol desaturase/sphingolipid hydroxylase (fatty acid hydroxylase superfamily)